MKTIFRLAPIAASGLASFTSRICCKRCLPILKLCLSEYNPKYMADIHEILLLCRIRNKLAFGEHFDLLGSENVKGAF